MIDRMVTPTFVPRTERWGLLPCADPAIDPDELFFSDDRDDPLVMARAQKQCAPCPVRAECQAHARSQPEWGIWGGESEQGRQLAGAPLAAAFRRQAPNAYRRGHLRPAGRRRST